ncbi:MAG: lysophospholipid acyltransferase family protein [Syntrophobacteraceae bacterium]|nr:lysophospholipid acyltransferase family protein [Syntrophobacteraceae bacterium]
MRLVRSVFFYLVFFVSTIIIGSLAVIGSFVSSAWAAWMAGVWGNVNLWAAGVTVILSGTQNLEGGPYILASNHQGWFDIFAALGKLPIKFSWLAKVELFKVPVLGQAMARAGYIPIDRGDRRKAFASMNQVAEVVRQGTSVFVFPEGTRSADGVIKDFKKGVFALAVKSEQPIVPISISGSYRILPKDSWMIHPGVIRFTIGKPIMSTGADAKSRETLLQEVREAIRANLTTEEAGGERKASGETAGVLSQNGGNI